MRVNLFIVFLVFTGIQNTVGQVLTTSPLSYYGIGETSKESNPIFQSLGYSGIAVADSNLINYNNPATYTALGSGYTLFSTGIHGRISHFTENNNQQINGYGNLNHLIIGMRLSKYFSTTFGLRPYSFRGYNFNERIFTGTDSINNEYKGIGTSQVVFLGFGAKLLNLKSTKLSVGSNVGYLFGTLTNDRLSRLIVSNSLAGGIEKRKTILSSLHFDIGVHFSHKITKNHVIDLGATYEPKQNLNSSFSDGLFYATNVFNEKLYDTISYRQESGSISMPSNLTIGFAYTLNYNNVIKNNRKLNSQIKITTSYSRKDYSMYTENFGDLSKTNYLGLSNRFGIGVQWIPERNYFENNSLSKFYQRLYYRTGFLSENTSFLNSSTKIKHFGITFGFGVPIFAQQSLSSVNFGVCLGRTQKTFENALSENYAAINLGVILSPSIFDKWFRKRKLD
jgi:hypothetical protein